MLATHASEIRTSQGCKVIVKKPGF